MNFAILSQDRNNLKKQPQTLKIFFGTEMWERYGFYVVQTLLALYLTQHFNWHDKRTYALVGSFTALTYLSPVIGGWIADKLIGQKRAIIFGALVLLGSYYLLAMLDNDFALTCSLAGIAVGTGLLKPNISSLLGNEYPLESSRRESGFTIFYMGITSGIILGTLLPSQLNYYFGWSTSFFSAAIGMLLSLAVFGYGIFLYKIKDYSAYNPGFLKISAAILIMVLLWAGAFYILFYPQLADLMFIAVIILSIAYLSYSIAMEPYPQAKQTLIIGLLCIISVVFWAFYFQMFLSLTLFISRVVRADLYGMPFPPPYYVTAQSLGMLIFGYFLSRKRLQLNLLDRAKNISKKFLMAIGFMILAYLIIVLVTNFANHTTLISPWLIIPAYLMISLAELLLSPVGLSAITILANRSKVSTMMGIFFVSLGLGAFLSGKLAFITAIPPGETNLDFLKSHYAYAFTELFGILLGASVVCLGLFLIIQKLLKAIERTSTA